MNGANPLLLVLVLASTAGAVRSHARGRGATAAGVLSGLVVLFAAVAIRRDEPTSVSWAPDLGLVLSWSVDGLAAAFLGLVGVVLLGVVAWNGAWRLGADHGRLVSGLLAFVAAMVGLLTADNLLTLFVFWELTTLTSYALIGFDGSDPAARSAARSSLLVTGLGGLALLAGAVLVDGTGATAIGTLVDTADPTAPTVVVGLWLLLLAAATKSAQVPFHGWLTGAGTAPTPASALLHAATLVVAGTYLVLRIAPLGTKVAGWSATALAVGIGTYAWAHWGSRRADDAKQLLAGTTAAQVGLAFGLAALATPKATVAAIALLLVHGLYKAGMFLVVGGVAKRTGSQRVADIAAGVRDEPAARAALWLGAVAMAGMPPLAGWVAKEAAVVVLLGGPMAWFTVPAVVVGTALGVVVAVRLVTPGLPVPVKKASPPVVLAVPLLAGVATLVLGPLSSLLTGASASAAAAGRDATFAAATADVKLVLWPGLVPALGVSVLAIAVGLAWSMADRRRSVPRGPTLAPITLSAGIDRFGDGASRLAALVTTRGRRTIVGTVVATSMVALWPRALEASRWPTDVPLAVNPLQAVAAVALVLGTFGVVRAQDRFRGAVMLGIVGFAMGGLFVVSGAPDLLLTQVVVEVVVVLIFAGVLRRLPRRVPGRRASLTDPVTFLRLAVAVTAGLLAADLALGLSDREAPRPVATAVLEEAVPTGGGTNAVNVVLTDFRAIDTLGELLVIFLSAAGGAGLARARARRNEEATPKAARRRSSTGVGRRRTRQVAERRDESVTQQAGP